MKTDYNQEDALDSAGEWGPSTGRLHLHLKLTSTAGGTPAEGRLDGPRERLPLIDKHVDTGIAVNNIPIMLGNCISGVVRPYLAKLHRNGGSS